MKPKILIVINRITAPDYLARIENIISLCGQYMPQFEFVTKTSNVDLGSSIITGLNPLGQAISMISEQATRLVLQAVNQGESFNVLIYDSSVVTGYPPPAGGSEYVGQAVSESNRESAFASMVYDHTAPVDRHAGLMLHELIHELFTICGNQDTLHEYLIAHGGYNADLLVDLQAVFAPQLAIYFEEKDIIAVENTILGEEQMLIK